MSKYLKPEYQKSALITIDVQRDTLDGEPLEISGTSDALLYMKSLLDCYRKNKLPIIHVVRIYKADGSNADICRREALENGAHFLQENSLGVELARELFDDDTVRYDSNLLLQAKTQEIGSHEFIIYKPRWGAFYQTQLQHLLKEMGVNTLVFSGCNYPNCPRTSIYEASERDYKIVLAEDATSGLYERGKEEMRNIGVILEPSENIIECVDR